MIWKKYNSWSMRLGVFMGVSVPLLYVFFFDTVQQIKRGIFFFILVYAILCLIDAIFEINKKRRTGE